MNATRTTIVGRTQCARTRGNPLAFVNGVVGVSVASGRGKNAAGGNWAGLAAALRQRTTTYDGHYADKGYNTLPATRCMDGDHVHAY